MLAEAIKLERVGETRGELGRKLRDLLAARRAAIVAQFKNGDQIARHMSDDVERAVSTLFSKNAKPSLPNKEPFAIVAIGGFGRRELAPHSDVDLLFLHGADGEEHVREALDKILYPLWDAGLKIGYGVHTPSSAVDFSREDMIARTAYLDARLITGTASLFEDFQERYDKLRRSTKNQFIAAKLEEQDKRQTQMGETRYLVEPDIKESKGGLRDLQTIRWIYKYVYGDTRQAKENIEKMMSLADRRALFKAERFYWAVRAHLHMARGRADDKLSFDVQPAIAQSLGYAARPDMTPSERLMKHYFVTTVEVGRLTRVLCAKLEEERAKTIPFLPEFLPRELLQDEADGKPNIKLRNGRLDFDDPAKATKTPLDLFRLFRAFSKKMEIDFHPDALAVVAQAVAKVTSQPRKDPAIAKVFLGILTKSDHPERVLRIMIETGLLAKYIPAFGEIIGRIEYGLYRKFTLDEQVLQTIALLRQLVDGKFGEEHPIASKTIKEDPNYGVYFLAALLHESAWTVQNNSAAACEKLATRIAKRLGLSAEDAALVGWATGHYQLMVRTAERRNMADGRTISNFAAAVKDRKRLGVLLVLSVCHLRVVAHNSWDRFTRRQFTELYEGSLAWFDGGNQALVQRLKNRTLEVREEIERRLSDWNEEDRQQFLRRVSVSMLRILDPELIVRCAYLVKGAEIGGLPAAVVVAPREDGFEAVVYADDRPGLLADLAGTIARQQASVRSVQAVTLEDGKAVDVFRVDARSGAATDEAAFSARLHEALLRAAREPSPPTMQLSRPFGDRRTIFEIEPIVRVDRAASDTALVVEAEGLDRPGLLYELASALKDLGVVISSAHIGTYGERAVDAFYLVDQEGLPVRNSDLIEGIRTSLWNVLQVETGA